MTPGVPAYAAAAALIGRELTVPEVAQSVVLTRAHRDSTQMPETESLAHFARSRATLVLHLAIRRTRELMASLVDDYGADCPVVVVANAEQPDQLVLRGTLADIADQVEAAGLRQAAVILVGRALAARDTRRLRGVAPLRDADHAKHAGRRRVPVARPVRAVSGCECRSAREVGVIPTWSSPL